MDSSMKRGVTPIHEFKFACPVCHQHIMANSDMAGAQVECPTCFRQIIVPQSKMGNTTKLILRGTQVKKGRTSIAAVSGHKPSPGETSLATLAAVVFLIVTTLVFAVRNYARNSDYTFKPDNQPHLSQTSPDK